MVITVDKTRTDGTAHNFLNNLKTDIPIVLVARSENLDFNEQVLSLAGKKWVLANFNELGWDWSMEFGHHFGVNTDKFPNAFNYEKWKVFDDFVRDNPPVLTFERELLKEDIKNNVLPICYPCFINPQPIQTKEEFNNRILEVFYSFGISHEYRKTIQGNIWAKSSQYGYSVCDNLFLLDHFIHFEKDNRKWLSVHIPWWARQPIEVITERNGWAKISISPAGSGRNCFRHSESPVNSVMLMWDDNLAWHEEWVHGVNCLKCEQGKEVETCIEWLAKDELYDIYLNGMITVDKYRVNNYLNYLEQQIKTICE